MADEYLRAEFEFWREMELLKAGAPTKEWRRLAEAVDLPVQGAAE